MKKKGWLITSGENKADDISLCFDSKLVVIEKFATKQWYKHIIGFVRKEREMLLRMWEKSINLFIF